MLLSDKILAINNDLPIRTDSPIHSGKVRSVYSLTAEDSRRLIQLKGYKVATDAPLAVMIISDRISAFDCIWKGEGGMDGVPGKGAVLNAISNYWFKLFSEKNLADSHILDIPHPFVWIVQKAKPVMIEAICRNYITGSMWRSYSKGEREFCGIKLKNDLKKDQKLDELLITPSTKGVLTGLSGIPEADDVNITRTDILNNYKSLNFKNISDIDHYEKLLKEGFEVINSSLAKIDQIFVDTSSTAVTITLPASPAVGNEVHFIDSKLNFNSNNLTIGRNSEPINGATSDLVVNENGESFTLVYANATKGWIFKTKKD